MEREDIKTFGAWVKSMRDKVGLTQVQLARDLDLATGTISAIERGTIASIGRKMKEQITAYFTSIEHKITPNSDIQAGIPDDSHESINHSSNDMNRILMQVVQVICEPDFKQRVDGVMKYLRCDEKKATLVILTNELNK